MENYFRKRNIIIIFGFIFSFVFYSTIVIHQRLISIDNNVILNNHLKFQLNIIIIST